MNGTLLNKYFYFCIARRLQKLRNVMSLRSLKFALHTWFAERNLFSLHVAHYLSRLKHHFIHALLHSTHDAPDTLLLPFTAKSDRWHKVKHPILYIDKQNPAYPS